MNKKFKEEREIEFCHRDFDYTEDADVPITDINSYPSDMSDEEIIEDLRCDNIIDPGDDFVFWVKDYDTGKVLWTNNSIDEESWIKMCVEDGTDPYVFIDSGYNYDFLQDYTDEEEDDDWEEDTEWEDDEDDEDDWEEDTEWEESLNKNHIINNKISEKITNKYLVNIRESKKKEYNIYSISKKGNQKIKSTDTYEFNNLADAFIFVVPHWDTEEDFLKEVADVQNKENIDEVGPKDISKYIKNFLNNQDEEEDNLIYKFEGPNFFWKSNKI